MKNKSFAFLLTASIALFISFHPFLKAESVADQKKSYPTDMCVVSDEKLGAMGETVEYVVKDKSGNDVLILLCCKECKKAVDKDPQAVIKKLEIIKASAKKSTTAYPTCGGCK
ncbi:MAG: hypothetical protein SGI98_01610 [Verrucomicrobiota bacterium]|nr:hypothetical protein [Verrucomicrobiota bacterium]